MTYFDLLARDHAAGSIPEEVFTDISFGELLTKYLGEKAASNIIAVIRRPLSAAGIKLRQELLLELEKAAIVDYMSGLKLMVQDLEIKYNAYHYQENPFYKATAFLALAEQYAAFVEAICNRDLQETISSTLLQDFIASFAAIMESAAFVQFKAEAEKLKEDLQSIGSVQVDIHTPEGIPGAVSLSLKKQPHLAEQLLAIADQYSSDRRLRRASGHKELSPNFVTGLSRLYPQIFTDLERFHMRYQNLISSSLFAYRNQFAFYLDLKSFFTALGKDGIPLCLPRISAAKRTVIRDAYDITLLLKVSSGIVPNDIEFNTESGFYLLTGANSGGKTAYLRAVAICHILFSAGGYIPAVDAQIYPFRQLFTQFPADERMIKVGRLEDEQRKVEEIMAGVDDRTLVLLNETFSSTNEELSLELSCNLIAKLCQAGAYGLFVTHHHQLADRVAEVSGETKIGFLTAVVLDDAAHTRTYKIRPQRVATQSYAQTILEKYGLTRSQLAKRLLEVK